MNRNRGQSGATLVVSLIMLVVLTLLVITAIRSGNTNLRIAGNMQVQGEVDAAAMQAIEQVISGSFTDITDAQTITVQSGPVSYSVVVAKPTCGNTVPLLSSDPTLKPGDANDQLCIGDSDPGDLPFDSSGKPVAKPTKCNQQQWDVQADVTDSASGGKITHHQGLSKRVYLPTPC